MCFVYYICNHCIRSCIKENSVNDFIFYNQNDVPTYYFHPHYFETGTPIHTDPDATDAFNALFVGHKRWVALPKDLYEFETELSCDSNCSYFDNRGTVYDGSNRDDKDKTNILWFKSILPQIR